MLTGDLVEGETTEGRQDVDAQECFVGIPTPLAGLGTGQVAVSDELVEGSDGPQLLPAITDCVIHTVQSSNPTT